MKTDTEAAGEYESKFRFYFVALVFTILAASVHSAPLDQMECFTKVSEVTGWFLLLICGLSSLSFLELTPVIYKNRAINKNQDNDEVIRNVAKEVLKETESKSSFRYFVAKWSFALGLILIIISRAIYGFSA